jgi:hypothetical protein
MARTKGSKDRPCVWVHTDDDEDAWDTCCGNKHCFIVDGPKENDYGFCPYCGRVLKAKAARCQAEAEEEGGEVGR